MPSRFLNGKIQIKDALHYRSVCLELDDAGAKWQSGNRPQELSDLRPRYLYVERGVITWGGSMFTHNEDRHREFCRRNLPLLEGYDG